MNPVKFRCYRCNQLLGVTRQKIGEVVACPRCLAELVVPDPAETETESTAGAEEPSAPNEPAIPNPSGALDSGVPLNYLDIRPEDIRAEHSPGPVSRTTVTEPPRSATVVMPVPTDPRPVEPEPIATTRIEAVGFEPANPAPPPAAITIPPIRVDGPVRKSTRSEPVTVRSRDLVLPRSVVASWSFFVLLALGFAFFAGLLAGHYVWRVH